jgi:predicted HD phosphohydrolase
VAADDRSAEVTQLLLSLRGVYDEDEQVDELDHALQSAAGAISAQADDELVVASLLHDIARSPLVAAIPGYADLGHDEVARRWLTPRFGERVGWLAGAHVAAKRYLAATDPEYRSILSPTSIASLVAQGGAAVDPIWTSHLWWPAAVQLRRFDDGAKVIGAPTPSVADVVAIVERLE